MGDIISARAFVDLHFKTSIPLILVSIYKIMSPLDFFALDKWWESSRTRLRIHRFPSIPRFPKHLPESAYTKFSHAGLIVIRICRVLEPELYILNPARSSRECVKITLCRQIFESHLCAVYYHPSLNEYCCLLKINDSWPKPIQHKVLNLGSNPCLKTIRNPFIYELKYLYASPIFINNYLYWMLSSGQDSRYDGRNDILEFDIISEDFRVLPCPVPLNTACTSQQTHLFNSSVDVLSFVLVLPNAVTIWRLEDRVEQLWTSTKYTLSLEIRHSYETVGIIALVDGILAFERDSRLFLCNLKEGTVKNYPKRKYSGDVSFFSHQMSLASLKNCKSELYIDKEGEVLVLDKPDACAK